MPHGNVRMIFRIASIARCGRIRRDFLFERRTQRFRMQCLRNRIALVPRIPPHGAAGKVGTSLTIPVIPDFFEAMYILRTSIASS